MEILFLLIPVSLFLMLVAFLAFLWSVKSDQFEDLDKEGWRVLQEENDQRDELQES